MFKPPVRAFSPARKTPPEWGLKFAANGGDRRLKSLGGGELDSGRHALQRLLHRLSSRPKENYDPQPIAGGVLLRAHLPVVLQRRSRRVLCKKCKLLSAVRSPNCGRAGQDSRRPLLARKSLGSRCGTGTSDTIRAARESPTAGSAHGVFRWSSGEESDRLTR